MKFLNKDKLEVLKEVWGYDSFRENQEEAVTQILNGNKDVLFIAKTGLGKSLVFQVPSVMMSGVTIVLSPLLSLMSDQVSNAGIKGLDAATYNSTMGKKQKKIVLDQLENNELDLLYIAPESILNAEMLEFIKDKVTVNFVAVDEAHCFKGSNKIYTETGNISFKDLFEIQEKGETFPLVLSSDSELKTSFNKILKVYKNTCSPMLQINFDPRSNIKTTRNHVFMTRRGEIKAEDLCLTDEVLTFPQKNYERLLNDSQMSFVIGSILGDGGLDSRDDFKMRISYVHSEKQKDYLYWKKSFLNTSSSRIRSFENQGYSSSTMYTFTSSVFTTEESVGSLPLGSKRESFPSWVYDNFDEKSLAVWIMDDGSYSGSSVSIHCNSFSEELSNIFSNLIQERFGIKSSVLKSRDYFYLRFDKENSELLCNLTESFILPSLNYKIGLRSSSSCFEDWSDSSIKLEYIPIESIKTIKDSDKFLYDIEVENNHNYFTFSTRGDTDTVINPILVHNCTSSYGSDFRPKYGQIAILREFIAAPFVALTATADTKTIEDMKKTLKLGDRGHKLEEFYQDLDRHSIFYNVFPKIGNGYKQILNFMGQHKKEDTGIIYCLTKASVDDLSRFLYRQGIKAKPYHAGLSTKDKEANLAQWMNKEIQVIVATIAFGMGIDFPSVRYVIHANIPTSLEGFSQESGRASRDGLPSKSYLLYDPADSRLIKWMLKQSIKNPATLSLRLNKFAKMSQYATSKTCYRKQILNYFNQEQKEDNCNSCSNCVSVKKL